jgi:hypothetical protein
MTLKKAVSVVDQEQKPRWRGLRKEKETRKLGLAEKKKI